MRAPWVVKAGARRGCLLAPLSGEAARAILRAGRAVADADLADDGRETEPHVTVKYGFMPRVPAAEVERVALPYGPLRFRLGKVGVFSADTHDVLFYEIDPAEWFPLGNSPEPIARVRQLWDLNAALADLPHQDTYADYKPHATIAYVKPGRGEKYRAALEAGQTVEVFCGELVYSDADKERTVIPLTGTKALRAPWVVVKGWEEAKHPRGQPANAGEFRSGGTSAPSTPVDRTNADLDAAMSQAPAARPSPPADLRSGDIFDPQETLPRPGPSQTPKRRKPAANGQAKPQPSQAATGRPNAPQAGSGPAGATNGPQRAPQGQGGATGANGKPATPPPLPSRGKPGGKPTAAPPSPVAPPPLPHEKTQAAALSTATELSQALRSGDPKAVAYARGRFESALQVHQREGFAAIDRMARQKYGGMKARRAAIKAKRAFVAKLEAARQRLGGLAMTGKSFGGFAFDLDPLPAAPWVVKGWEESRHPRGQPENAGEFASQGGGGSNHTSHRPDIADHEPVEVYDEAGDAGFTGTHAEAKQAIAEFREQAGSDAAAGLFIRRPGEAGREVAPPAAKPTARPDTAEKLPPPSDYKGFKTGEPAEATVYRGEASGGSGSGMAALGHGRYYGLEPVVAERFSKKGTVRAGTVALKNPVVIHSDEDMVRVKQAAEKESGEDFGRDGNNYVGFLYGDQPGKFTAALRRMGYDGVITTYKEAPGGEQLVAFPSDDVERKSSRDWVGGPDVLLRPRAPALAARPVRIPPREDRARGLPVVVVNPKVGGLLDGLPQDGRGNPLGGFGGDQLVAGHAEPGLGLFVGGNGRPKVVMPLRPILHGHSGLTGQHSTTIRAPWMVKQFDPAEKRDAAGEWTAGGGDSHAADPDSHARKLATRISSVPHAVRQKVSAFVRKRYAKLAARYGDTGAKAILGATILLLPAPVPGTTLIPVAFAEIVLRLRRMTGKSMGVDDATVQREAKALLADLYAEMGEKAPKGKRRKPADDSFDFGANEKALARPWVAKAGSFTGTVFGRYYIGGQEVDAATYNAQKDRSVPRDPKVPDEKMQKLRGGQIADAAHKFTANVDHYHREVRAGKMTADQAADALLAMHGKYETAVRAFAAQQFERIKRAIVDQYGDEEEVRSALKDFETKFGKKLDEHIGAADERSVDLHHEGDDKAKRAERDRTRSAHYDTAHLLQVLTMDGYKIVSSWIEADMDKRDKKGGA